jgi:PTS system nitrogen regulatory IIA component
MNLVGELLQLEDIALDLDVATSGALLRQIAAMLARRSRLVEAEVLKSLMAREELGSTALGHGIAIPHARMAECGTAAAAFVRTKFGIPFNAPDGKPVSVFLGLIVPKQANERHLKLLATAAGIFSERSLRERIGSCADPAQALDLLASWPESPLSASVERPSA